MSTNTRLDAFLKKRKILTKKRVGRTMKVISVNVKGSRREMIIPSERMTQSFRKILNDKTICNVA